MNIELHIEELILHGFAPQDRFRISEAVQNELTRLLACEKLPSVPLQRNLEFPRLDAGSFHVRAGERPESIGIHIGQKVFESMKHREAASGNGPGHLQEHPA